MPTVLLRLTQLRARNGNRCKTSLYGDVQQGLLTPPVRIGPRASAWPEHEVEAINAARIAGQTDEQIRALVRQLISLSGHARQRTIPPWPVSTILAGQDNCRRPPPSRNSERRAPPRISDAVQTSNLRGRDELRSRNDETRPVGVYREVEEGKRDSQEGSRLIYMLSQITKVLELTEIERRLTVLEGKNG